VEADQSLTKAPMLSDSCMKARTGTRRNLFAAIYLECNRTVQWRFKASRRFPHLPGSDVYASIVRRRKSSTMLESSAMEQVPSGALH
jgi:hypothetical protein